MSTALKHATLNRDQVERRIDEMIVGESGYVELDYVIADSDYRCWLRADATVRGEDLVFSTTAFVVLSEDGYHVAIVTGHLVRRDDEPFGLERAAYDVVPVVGIHKWGDLTP